MLVTNYGLEHAVCQVAWYHVMGREDVLTLSQRYIEEYLSKIVPSILIGFTNVPINLLRNKTYLINNSKMADQKYSIYEKHICQTGTSKVTLLMRLLKKQSKKMCPLMKVMDDASRYEKTDIYHDLYDYYESIGHDSFVNRFKENTDIMLSEEEKDVAFTVIDHKIELIKTMVQNNISFEDNIACFKCDYSSERYLTHYVMERYEDQVLLLCLWNFSADGDIRISLKSRNNLAEMIAKNHGGYGFKQEGSYSIPLFGSSDYNYDIREMIKKEKDELVKSYHNNKFGEAQKLFEMTKE